MKFKKRIPTINGPLVFANFNFSKARLILSKVVASLVDLTAVNCVVISIDVKKFCADASTISRQISCRVLHIFTI